MMEAGFLDDPFTQIVLLMTIKDILHNFYFYGEKVRLHVGLYIASWAITLICMNENFCATLCGALIAMFWVLIVCPTRGPDPPSKTT